MGSRSGPCSALPNLPCTFILLNVHQLRFYVESIMYANSNQFCIGGLAYSLSTQLELLFIRTREVYAKKRKCILFAAISSRRLLVHDVSFLRVSCSSFQLSEEVSLETSKIVFSAFFFQFVPMQPSNISHRFKDRSRGHKSEVCDTPKIT